LISVSNEILLGYYHPSKLSLAGRFEGLHVVSIVITILPRYW
jgi:hypothetical protein